MTLSAQALDFLSSKGLTEETASLAELSDAKAYESTFLWYLYNQKVLPENAALASKVFIQKYALHDNNGICLENNPEDMWDRIAEVLAEVEMNTNPKPCATYKNDLKAYFKEGLNNFAYSPQGSGLYSLGNSYVKASSSNCFVEPPPDDNLGGIFKTAGNMAKIFAARGGVGFDISSLRPRAAKTNNASRTSTGAVSFMDFYSYITGMIGMEGRRGALMQSIKVNHPDILNFIKEKRDEDKQAFFSELSDCGIDINDHSWSSIADRLKSTSHANISVMISDTFMNSVENDLDFELLFEFKDKNYEPISKIVKAREIWNALMKSAWESAEPGILNWDLIKRECPADQYSELTDYTWCDPVDNVSKKSLYSFETVGVNPCAEETLSAFDSCNLGIFNLPVFVTNPYTKEAFFDWNKYKKIISLGVRAQDNIKEWDIPKLPLEGNRLAGILGRRISVGNTGLADCLAALGHRYDTREAIIMAEKIFSFMANTAYSTSALLAKEKGKFPAFNLEKHLNSPFIQRLLPETLDLIKKYGLRNIGLLTQAPAGSMSILFRNCSSGIEPVFMSKYVRNVKKAGSRDFEQHTINHQAIEDCFLLNGDPSVFVEAGNIDYSMRIKMQSAIQKHIDHSISSTLNLPNSITVEEVSKIYMEAYKAGLKGVTVYRDRCRTGVLVSTESKKHILKTIERPKTTTVDIHKVKYKEKSWAVLVGRTDNGPLEVFAGIDEDTPLPNKYHKAELTKKSRGHYSLTVWLSEDDEGDIIRIGNIGARFPSPEGMALTRFISLSLRNGVSTSEICEQLQKSSSSLFDYPNVLNRVLKTYLTDEEVVSKEKARGKTCPDCNEPLEFKRESGCLTELCSSCGYVNSKCG